MKTTRITFAKIILFLTILLLSACGSLQFEVENGGQPDSDLQNDQTPPVEILVARDTALFYIRNNYGEAAPPTDANWTVAQVPSDGSVGASSYRFESQGWTLTLAYPIVPPEATIYSIELFNSTSGFHWMGQVDAQGNVTEMVEVQGEAPVIAWAGRFKALVEGAGPNDYFVMIPEGVGAVGVEGIDKQMESAMELLTASSGDYAHIWGCLSCGVEDFNGCRVLVERIRFGNEITEAEPVEGWEGVIYNGPPEPRSGGDDYFALVGDYPVQYGIWAMDEGLRAELEALRDTQTVIRIWGTIVAGIPDWNGTQILVTRYERVETPNGAIPPAPAWDEPDRGWITYTNQRYGYQFQYPPTADIEEIGVQGYPSDENGLPVGGLPEGVTLDTYFAYLEETYGNNLCVGIKYSLGYIYISAAENTEARYATCGRTGVGVAEIIPKNEQITIAGLTVEASGMEVKGEGESLDAHNETMVVWMPDGTRIEFGAAPRMDATYEDYLMKTREMLLQILETFEYIN
jgi:hypothetical protein